MGIKTIIKIAGGCVLTIGTAVLSHFVADETGKTIAKELIAKLAPTLVK